MRLTYMYYLMKNNYAYLEALKFEERSERIVKTTQYYGFVEGWTNGKEALKKIQNIPHFSELACEILNHSELQKKSVDSFTVTVEVCRELAPKYNSFLQEMKGVIEFCEKMGLNENPIGFDVKMPPTKDFNEFTVSVNSLNRVLQQCPYLNVDGEKIEISSVDIGSVWLRFAVITAGSTTVLNNLAKFVDKCVKIRSHILTCHQQEQLLRAMEQKTEVMDLVIQGFKDYRKKLTQDCVDELKSEIGELKNGEDEERVRQTLSSFSDLMAMGLEIYASIEVPEDIQNIFPTSDELLSLSDPIKLLGKETSENE